MLSNMTYIYKSKHDAAEDGMEFFYDRQRLQCSHDDNIKADSFLYCSIALMYILFRKKCIQRCVLHKAL